MSKASGETYRSIRLCVDSYQHGELKGRYYNLGLAGGSRKFESLAQFLVSAENLFDSINFPQAFAAKRSFAPSSDVASGEYAASESRTGGQGTFIIRLLFRQHTSWQGSVTWLEGGGEQTFRSVLELILLMDSALGGCEEGIA